MDIKQILEDSRTVWGNKKLVLPQIIIRMGKIYGDICRYARGESIADRSLENELKKELGNLIVSATRWCDDLGFDPCECISLAAAAQKRFTPYRGDDKIIPSDTNELLVLGQEIWQGKSCGLEQIVVRLGKVIGDICRYARNTVSSDRAEGEAGLKKEMGNVIFSSIVWCADLGYDLQECINLAFKAQKEYQK